MSIKCIYRTNTIEPHCDKEAEYIYTGKSYCAKHLEIRSKENEELARKDEERMVELRKQIV